MADPKPGVRPVAIGKARVALKFGLDPTAGLGMVGFRSNAAEGYTIFVKNGTELTNVSVRRSMVVNRLFDSLRGKVRFVERCENDRSHMDPDHNDENSLLYEVESYDSTLSIENLFTKSSNSLLERVVVRGVLGLTDDNPPPTKPTASAEEKACAERLLVTAESHWSSSATLALEALEHLRARRLS